MARNQEQVVSDLQTAYREIDPSADVVKGPIYDAIVRPVSGVISEVEVAQDRTDRLASADFTAVANDEELERMASTVGAGSPQGSAAVGVQIFGTLSRPRAGVTIEIPKGLLVSSSGGDFIYQTTDSGLIDGNFAETYYNPTRRSYEVEVTIEAVAVGANYNLPAYRVRRLVQGVTGVDFTENRSPVTGGVDPGGTDSIRARAEAKLQGQELGTPLGLAAAIVNAFDEVDAVATVTSTNYGIFRRPLTGPGLDVYYTGERITEYYQVYTAIGGELETPFDNSPTTEVTSVLVNGLSQDYEFVIDEDPATRGSTSDTSYLQFASPLGPGDQVDIKAKYDALADAITESFGGSQGFFGTDVLLRRALRKNPVIEVTGEADSGFNAFSLRSEILAEIIDFFNIANPFAASYFPSELRDHLATEVIGLRKPPIITIFQLEDRALLDVEPIELFANEIIEVDEDNITINVR